MLVLFGLTFTGLVAPLSISKEQYWLSDISPQHHYLPPLPNSNFGRILLLQGHCPWISL